MKVGLKRLAHGHDLALPHYATAGAAGLDLLAAIDDEIELLPGQRVAVPCGIAIELPHDMVDTLVDRVVERLEGRKRWHSVESLADELNMSARRVRGLRERGMPAKRIGKRLVFDLREVEAWLERL